MNKIFYDNILAVKAKKKGDFPVFFMGSISMNGVSSSTVKMKDGTDLAMSKFTIGLYDRRKDVDYVLSLAGLTEEVLSSRSEKYDNLDVVCFGASAKLAEGFKPGMQVCGGGVLRKQKDGKVQLLVSGLMKPAKEPALNAKARYERFGFDALRPLASKTGEPLVVFAGTRGKYWDVKTFVGKKGPMSVAHPQLSFYKQNEAIAALKEAVGCDKIAYEGETSSAFKSTMWGKDAEWGAKKADGDQVVGYGVLQIDSYNGNNSIVLNVKGLARTFNNYATGNQTGDDTVVSTPVTESQVTTQVAEPVDMDDDEYIDMYI